MRTNIKRRVGGFVPFTGRMAAGAVLALSLAACDTNKILDVHDPEFPTDASLQEPTALPLLVSGAMGEFWRAYGGSGLDNLGFITSVGLFTDEFLTSDTFNDRNALDERNQQPPSQGNPSDFAFERLQRARRATRDAAATVEKIRGANDPDRATLLALEAYTYVALAEGYCGSVPISNVESGEFKNGTPLTTTQLLDSAVVRFDRSLAASPNDLARVGKGRALLDQGKVAEAAAAVNGVQTGSAFLMEYSENTFQNSVWNLNSSNGRFTVSDSEGGGLNFRTAGDPRVPVFRQPGRVGFDKATPLYEQAKYDSRDADIPLAGGVEARLIEAEAALQAHNNGSFISILNNLRAGVAGLAPLGDPGNDAARQDLLFRERAFWMYATGHRLGDFRRLVTQYGRQVDDVYPSGAYPGLAGNSYGDKVVFPVPFDEEQNPEFHRDQCDVTSVS
jgi:hypothetical protein